MHTFERTYSTVGAMASHQTPHHQPVSWAPIGARVKLSARGMTGSFGPLPSSISSLPRRSEFPKPVYLATGPDKRWPQRHPTFGSASERPTTPRMPPASLESDEMQRAVREENGHRRGWAVLWTASMHTNTVSRHGRRSRLSHMQPGRPWSTRELYAEGRRRNGVRSGWRRTVSASPM